MRFRHLSLVASLALVAAACGGQAEDTTTSSSPQTTTTLPAVEAVLLSYSLQPGTSLEYEVDLNQKIDMTTNGDVSAFGEGEELPGQMSVNISGTSVFAYSVAEGPEPGTFEVTITGDFSDLEFNGTIDGESVDNAEIPDMAEVEPVDVTIVVDEQGNVIPDDNAALGDDPFGAFGSLDMFDQLGSLGFGGQFIGPPFPDEEVTVGDTWSETRVVPVMPGQDPMSTQVDSEVVTEDNIDGNEVFVVETTTKTAAFEFDLAEFLIGFMTSFMSEDATEEERAELDAMVDELRFAFSIDESVADMTIWFDHEAGVTRQAEVASGTRMVMDINVPDETTGEMVEFTLDMNLDQEISYRLKSSE